MADGDTLNVVWQWLPPAGIVTVVVIISAYLFLTRKKDGGAIIEEEAAVVIDCGAGPIPDEHRDVAKRAIVYIETPVEAKPPKPPSVSRGSGFIAELEVEKQKKWLLFTCNHVLPSLPDAMKSGIYFGRKSNDQKGTLIQGKDLFGEELFFKTDGTNFPAPWNQKRFDYTAVEVRKDVMETELKDNLPVPLSLMMKREGLHVKDMLYVVHYPEEKDFKRCENGEHIRVLNGPFIGHIATTYGGSSGSPMLRESNNVWVVVGLHRGGLPRQINLATCIDVIVDDIQGRPYKGHIPNPKSFVIKEEAGRDSPPSYTAAPPSADEAALKDVCWVPFDIKTLLIEAEGGLFYLQPASRESGGKIDDAISIEVPPDAIGVSDSVMMRYAVIPHGPFVLPNGYRLGSMAVYIFYDGRHVTKPLIIHLPHWYGGENHTTDGLSFALASHSLKEGKKEYCFERVEGGTFSQQQQYGVYSMDGHSSLFAVVLKEETTSVYLATQWDQRLVNETYTRIAITYYSAVWLEILKEYWTNWERNASATAVFQFRKQLFSKCSVFGELPSVQGVEWKASLVRAEVSQDEVCYPSRCTASKLEGLVKSEVYPPAVKCAVLYSSPPDFERPSLESFDMKITGTTKRIVSFPITVYSANAPGGQPLVNVVKESAVNPPPSSPPTVLLSEVPVGQSFVKVVKESAVSSSVSSSAALPSAEEVLEEFREKFIKEMEAEAVANDLRVGNIIPESCEADISPPGKGRTWRNQTLHQRLVNNCTREALIEACEIFIAKQGYTEMNALGRAMKKELEPATADPEKVLKNFREQFIRVMEAEAVAYDLRVANIIPESCEADISPPGKGRTWRNQTLHQRLVNNCTREALIEACEIFIAKQGYTKMNALGRAMKKELEPATALANQLALSQQYADAVTKFDDAIKLCPDNPKDAYMGPSKKDKSGSDKLHGPVNGDECYFWRTTSCNYGVRCFYKHIPGHEGVDLKDYMATGRK